MKIKIKKGDFINLNIPIINNFNNVDLSSNTNDFIDKEVKASINKVVDYEKFRFGLADSLNKEIDYLSYELSFLKNSSLSGINFDDIGFTNNDIKFRRLKFTKSFLRLSFYDSDEPNNNNLINYVTIFCRVTNKDVIPVGQVSAGLPKNANQISVKFYLNNPIKTLNGYSEGFYLYFNNYDLPKDIFMKADFFNAKTGNITNLSTVNYPLSISDVIKKLYTKFSFIKSDESYLYKIDALYSSNVYYVSDIDGNGIADDKGVNIKLFEIQVI